MKNTNLTRELTPIVDDYTKQLEKKAKPLSALIREETFEVKSVYVEFDAKSITPISEYRVGGPSPSYDTGYAAKTIIEVTPLCKEVPVEKLCFYGVSTVRAGDKIIAKMPVYDEKVIAYPDPISPTGFSKSLYFERPYKQEEEAIEIKILGDEKDKISRIERSATYRNYLKA